MKGLYRRQSGTPQRPDVDRMKLLPGAEKITSW
jgi:hypothetical protein